MALTRTSMIIAIVAICGTSTLGQLSGSITPDMAGGNNVNIMASKFLGNPNHNIGGGVFAAGNTRSNTPSLGAFGTLNLKDHSLGVSKTITPGVSDTFSQNARLNILKTPDHRVDANVFNSHTRLNNGFAFDKRGGSLDYTHRAGHGLSLGASHIPKFGTTAELTGKANLWRSPSGLSTFDLTGSASRTFGGPMAGRNNFGAGLGFSHRF
ncbi:unnamed protein product [Hermetia illucens]|uniref:Uncharacterized protein n=1 Tax=Hermetia illucens TaxID=343691 RepID=A0A7R8UZF5_HERIL|nr:attacin-A-like [Hermetia illucens]CAD7089436.1 unnamed protein product [Hermetia illucens]